MSPTAFARTLARGQARRKTAPLTEIALSGAILKPVARWITNARRISMSHQRDRLTGAKSSPCEGVAVSIRRNSTTTLRIGLTILDELSRLHFQKRHEIG